MIAMRNGSAGNYQLKRLPAVAERTPFRAVIVIMAGRDLIAGLDVRLRIQPTLPAPLNYADNMLGQSLCRGAPLRRKHNRSLGHRLPVTNADDCCNMDVIGSDCQPFRCAVSIKRVPNRAICSSMR